MWWQIALWVLLIPLAVITWYSRRLGILILLAGLSGYALRTTVFGVPTTWLEFGIYIVVLISLWRGDYKEYKKYFHTVKVWYWLPVLLWVAASVFGILIARDTIVALGIFKGWVIDPLLFSSVLLVSALKENEPLKFWRDCIGALFLGGILTGVVSAIMSELNGLVRWQRGSASANQLGLYLVPIISSAIAWFLLHDLRALLSKKISWCWLAGIGWLLVVIYKINSFTAILTVILVIVILGLTYLISIKKILVYLLAVGVVMGVFIPWFNNIDLNSWGLVHRNERYGISSWDVRKVFWREARELIVKHPIAGVGLGQWQNIFKQEIEPFISESNNQGYRIEFYYTSLFPHNLWLTIWLSQGILGILAIMALLGIVAMNILRTSRPLDLVVGVVLVTQVMQGIFDTPFYKNDLSIIFWFFITIAYTIFYSTYETTSRSQAGI